MNADREKLWTAANVAGNELWTRLEKSRDDLLNYEVRPLDGDEFKIVVTIKPDGNLDNGPDAHQGYVVEYIHGPVFTF